MNLIIYNSRLDNPNTDIIAIDDYVCGYACKDSEPTGATAYLFKNMVNAAYSDKETGKSMSAKMLTAPPSTFRSHLTIHSPVVQHSRYQNNTILEGK